MLRPTTVDQHRIQIRRDDAGEGDQGRDSPEELARGSVEQRRAVRVRVGERHGVAPPAQDGVFADRPVARVLEAEEDHDERDGDARVERGGQHICVRSRCQLGGQEAGRDAKRQGRDAQLYFVHHEKWRRRMT